MIDRPTEKAVESRHRFKVSQKVYNDPKRGAKENNIVPGDQVLFNNTKATGKLASNFESEPYTVKAKEGHELTLQYKDVKTSTGKIILL